MNISNYINEQAQKLKTYLRARLAYFAELNHPLKPSQALIEHSALNGRSAYRSMSVISSATSMAPCQEAIDASSKAGRQFQDKTNDTILSLQKKRRGLSEKASDLQQSYTEYLQYYENTDELGYTAPAKLLRRLNTLLADVPKNYRDHMCASWEDLDPAVAEYMEHFDEQNYTLKTPLPTGQKEQGKFNSRLFKFFAHTIEIMFEGFTDDESREWPSLINPPLSALDELIAAERRKIEAQAHCDDIANEQLKPQVAANLKNLHGIVVTDMGNISTCHGTNTTIVTSAIAGLTTIEPGKEKLLLQFAMSWDNYKSYEASEGLRHHFLDGPVTGKGLEEFIQNIILQGRSYEEEDARRLVKDYIGGILISIPENPTGNNLSASERRSLINTIVKYDIRPVILDEIYSVPGCKSLSTEPGMEGRCYVAAGTSKYMSHDDKMSFGYSDNPAYAAAVEKGIPERAQLSPRQAASFAAFLKNTPLSYHEKCEAAHKAKRDIVSAAMTQVNAELGMENAVSWLKTPESGRLGVICVAPELAAGCGIRNSTDFAQYLYKMGGVDGLPLGDANADEKSPKGIRVNFSKPDDFLITMVGRIGIAAKHMQEKVQFADIEGKNLRGEDAPHQFSHVSPFVHGGSFLITSSGGKMLDMGTLSDIFQEIHARMAGKS